MIDVLLFDNLNVLDVAGPVQAFHAANLDGCLRYRLRYLSMEGAAVTASCGLRLQADGALPDSFGQDLLVPGGRGVDCAIANPQLQHFVRGWEGTRDDSRIISICSGALVLAAAGHLDGRRATTHWVRETQARDQFPKVDWSTDDLYHIDGHIFTSAGVTAGIDLTLEIIRRDHGAAVALAVARELVVYFKRNGGQNQFADLLEAQFTTDKELSRLIAALHNAPSADWTLDRMADIAGLTPRTLMRRFARMTGHSPVKFLERFRVKRATDALTSGVSVGRSVDLSGFSSFQQMQRAFKRQLGTTVGRYVETFGDAA